MILAAFIHIVIHWSWITGTASRSWKVITGKQSAFGPRLTYNILLDLIIGFSFVLCAISGAMFMIFPASGPDGVLWILSKTFWDLLHTWSGVVMAIAGILHFALHWKWIVNITRKLLPYKHNPVSNREPGLNPENAA